MTIFIFNLNNVEKKIIYINNDALKCKPSRAIYRQHRVPFELHINFAFTVPTSIKRSSFQPLLLYYLWVNI